jgi:hypothetical protein
VLTCPIVGQASEPDGHVGSSTFVVLKRTNVGIDWRFDAKWTIVSGLFWQEAVSRHGGRIADGLGRLSNAGSARNPSAGWLRHPAFPTRTRRRIARRIHLAGGWPPDSQDFKRHRSDVQRGNESFSGHRTCTAASDSSQPQLAIGVYASKIHLHRIGRVASTTVFRRSQNRAERCAHGASISRRKTPARLRLRPTGVRRLRRLFPHSAAEWYLLGALPPGPRGFPGMAKAFDEGLE